jgi:hypothetical protein
MEFDFQHARVYLIVMGIKNSAGLTALDASASFFYRRARDPTPERRIQLYRPLPFLMTGATAPHEAEPAASCS